MPQSRDGPMFLSQAHTDNLNGHSTIINIRGHNDRIRTGGGVQNA
jgi:hypothetical protein